MRPKAKLERAVVYARREDGTLDIKLRHPWDGKRRLEAFPWRIQLKVQGEHYFMATPEESSKLWTARFISDELHAAVWDDIMCVRATEALAHEARTDRAVARDIQHLFADFADPTTLQRLDARFKERGR